ncbi:MAG: hypothetical protein AW07_04439 [Candidatus Accumulibacter sp. SK-11]|nr:MAG: hypothetical protein AW07_04439 [Candidatus Accumulibacter sp. SK-11]
MAQPGGKAVPQAAPVFLRRVRPEQRYEALVQFRADEREPFLQVVARETVGAWCETTLGDAVGDVLQDRCGLRQPIAIAEFEYRDVAFRVDGSEVAAVGKLALADVDANEIEVEPGLAQRNVRRQR